MAIPLRRNRDVAAEDLAAGAPPTFTALCPTLRIVQPTSLHALQPVKKRPSRGRPQRQPAKLTHDRSFTRISDSAWEDRGAFRPRGQK